jgi:uncharacterized membrane protein
VHQLAGRHHQHAGDVLAHRRAPAARDRIVSLVLAAHTRVDRPLGFDQVVQLCRGRVTREQVRVASATLCRDGQLDRIRSGVYQWSGGVRAVPDVPPAPTPAAVPTPRRHRELRPVEPTAPAPAAAHPTAAELFRQLFPSGVHMTAELLADYEPIFVLVITLVLGRRIPTSAATLLGVAIGFGGVVVLLGVDGSGPGAGLVLVASASYALGAVLVGRWFSDVPPLRVVSPMILLAAPVLVAVAATTETLPSPTWTGVGAVAVLGLACTAGGFWTFFTLIARADASRAALITYVAPIVAVAAGAILLGEPIGVRTVFGIILIFVGAALATRRTKPVASADVAEIGLNRARR